MTWDVHQRYMQVLVHDQRPRLLVCQLGHELTTVPLVLAVSVGRGDTIFYGTLAHHHYAAVQRRLRMPHQNDVTLLQTFFVC